jgi:hypothetical protein
MCKKSQKQEEATTTPPYKHCLNCGSELQGLYCHTCGQQAVDPRPSVKSFVMEYIHNAFMWDPKFLYTIRNLVCRPGHLTNEFLDGKIVSYVHPLKLNMFILFVLISFFLFFSGQEKLNNSMQIFTDEEMLNPILQMQTLSTDTEIADQLIESPRDTIYLCAPLQLATKHPHLITNIETIENTNGDSLDKWRAVVPRYLIEENIITLNEEGYYYFNKESHDAAENVELLNTIFEQMIQFCTKYFPLIVLFTAPFIALAVRLVRRKDKCPQINHFIFALHYTAFLELMCMIIFALHLIISPPKEILEWGFALSACIYLTISFRKVYGTTSWIKAIIQAIFINLTYLLLFLLIIIIIFIIVTFTVLINHLL